MKITAIALKDLLRSLRNTFLIGMAVAAPLLLTGLIYFAFGGMGSGDTSMPALKVGVVNLDTLPAGSAQQQAFGTIIRSVFFDESVKSWITASDYPDAASARQAVDQQEVGVVVVIPSGFSADFIAGSPNATITMIQDPTLTITPLVVRSMLNSLLDGFSGGGIAYQTISERQQAFGLGDDPALVMTALAHYQDWFVGFERDLFHNPEKAVLTMRAAAADQPKEEGGIPGLMKYIMTGQMIFFAFFTAGYAMMSILQEQEEGTLARLFTMPIHRTSILTGKFLAVVLTVTLQGVVLIVAAHYAFQITWGDPLGVVLALFGQVIAATGLGVLIISFVKSTRQGGVVLGGLLSVLGMMSGLFTVAVPAAAVIFEPISRFTPQGWVLATWKVVLSGQPFNQILLPLAMCFVFGIVFFAIGSLSFRRRFA